MTIPLDPQMPDIASSLKDLGETTTTADLLRREGQSKKVKVLSEKKLMDWILALLKQHMAGKQDAFSDQEKEELVKATQAEIAKKVQQQQQAEREANQAKSEMRQMMAQLASAQGNQQAFDDAVKALQTKLRQAEEAKENLQQDYYEQQDQLQEKLQLLSTTISEKDKLRDTVRQQMLRSTALVEGVLGLDQQYYGGRHAEQNPVPEEAGDDERFYHDFDVGAKIIGSLSQDLEQLRAITKAAGDSKPGGDVRTLEADLALLKELKAGSLSAMDVAQPVAGLVEALDGARCEAENLRETVAKATGAGGHTGAEFTAVPDADSEPPAQVLAGATTVARELAAELARTRGRFEALKAMSEEADQARNQAEEEQTKATTERDKALSELAKVREDLVAVEAEHRRLVDAIAAKAAQEGRNIAPEFNSEDPHQATEASISAIEKLKGGASPDARAAIVEQVERANRLANAGLAIPPSLADSDAECQALRAAGQALETALAEQRQQLEREKATLAAARSEADHMRRQLAEARIGLEATRAVAEELLKAAKGDDRLADGAADLALAKDEEGPGTGFGEQVRKGVADLALRKQELALEVERLKAKVAAATASADHISVLAAEAERVRAEMVRTEERLRAVESERDAATQELNTSKARVEHMRAELQDATTQVRSAQSEAEAAKADAAVAQARLAAALAEQSERAKAERVMARDLVQLAQEDPTLAESVAGLAETPARPGQPSADLPRELCTAVAALVARQQALRDEARNLAQEVERRKAELAEADSHAAAARTQAAQVLVEAAGDDPELKAAATRAVQDGPQALVAAIAALAEAKRNTERERDEMALSGKEIITAVTAQREAREAELKKLRTEHDALATQTAELQTRSEVAESANRRLAESLSQMAAVVISSPGLKSLPGAETVEDPRVDLELALSELPAEDEQGIQVSKDTALRLADAGRRLSEALGSRLRSADEALAKACAERDALRTQVDEQSNQTRSYTRDLGATRKNLDEAKAQAAQLRAEEERLRSELIKATADRAEREAMLASLQEEVAGLRAAQGKADEERQLARAETEALRGRLEESQRLLNATQAEVADWQARSGAGAEHLKDELNAARKELAKSQEAMQRIQAELTELHERADAAEPRLKRQREEFDKLMEERDALIQAKEAEIDELRVGRVDAKALQAELEAKDAKLAAAQERLRQLERSSGDHSQAVRVGDMGKEVARLQQERDRLRQEKRQLEGDLAESTGVNEELKTQLEEKRKELLASRELADREVTESRARELALREEFHKLKEEVVGLRTRIRRLTEKSG